MFRYLLNISYIGTQFRGVQRHKCLSDPQNWDVDTIQGNLNAAFNAISPINTPYVYVSSRTDTGVHALHSTAHVDLQNKLNKPYNTHNLMLLLNKYMLKNRLDIRVLSVRQVNNNFHSRYNAISRSYLYRFAIAESDSRGLNSIVIPIEEFRRCHFISTPNFNIDSVRDAARLFIGKHDFRSFMKAHSTYDKNSVRTIKKLEITEGKSISVSNQYSYPSCVPKLPFEYWDITIEAKSFVYRQVRRIVAVLIAVGQGKLTCKDVTTLLQVPSRHSWNCKAVTVPSHGLYLTQVLYDPKDLEYNPSENQSISNSCIKPNHTC